MTYSKKYGNRKTDPGCDHKKYAKTYGARIPFPIFEGMKCHNNHCLEQIVAGPGALVIRNGNPSVFCEGHKPIFGPKAGVTYYPVRFYYPKRKSDKKDLKKDNPR